MGKSVRAHTVRLHKQIKKQKLQKNELRRAELIASRAAESLAKYNASLEADSTGMQSLTPMEANEAKIIIEEVEAAMPNVMAGIENLGEIPLAGNSMKKQRGRARGRK